MPPLARPDKGVTFAAGGFGDVDNRFQTQRTGLLAVLIRDARGADTNISPHDSAGAPLWTPFAKDGGLRGDLFAHIRKDGNWIANPTANEGFHLMGAFSDGNGPTTKPNIDTDEQMIEQTNVPFDVVVTKEDEPFSFTAIESGKPVLRRLRNNLPLVGADGKSLVELPGGADAGWAKPLEADSVDRQALLISARRRNGKTLYEVEGYACNRLTDIGSQKKGKKGDAAELTFKPVPDGYFMAKVDGEVKPILKYTWVSGDGWTSLASGLAISPSTVSVTVSAGASKTRQLVVTDATGVDRTAAATYVSATPATATVSTAGLVTGVAVGSTTVTVTFGGASATVPVTVAT